MADKSRIGFISTRFAGTDGVSLETRKWVTVLESMGHECCFFAGESDWPDERSFVVDEAHFKHPDVQDLNRDLFDDYKRDPETSHRIRNLQNYLKEKLHQFIQRFEPKLLIIENAFSLPMNVPLGLALTELIAETALPTIAHHHDFTWERNRFSVSAAEDYLRASFPPTLHHINHVVINSFAKRQLALRTGVASTLIPNVMDFETSLQETGQFAENLRSELGIDQDAYLLLQPTRIVPRKRIELAIELTRRLNLKCCLVITHESGDEGVTYEKYLRDYAHLMDVDVRFASERFAQERGETSGGSKVYSLKDAYLQADLVTYPSIIEGFGNAFLEAIYYKRPIMISTYEIFKTDIQPKGFELITFADFIEEQCIQRAEEVLQNKELAEEMVEKNFELGRRHYSYSILEHRLEALIDESLGVD